MHASVAWTLLALVPQVVLLISGGSLTEAVL